MRNEAAPNIDTALQQATTCGDLMRIAHSIMSMSFEDAAYLLRGLGYKDVTPTNLSTAWGVCWMYIRLYALVTQTSPNDDGIALKQIACALEAIYGNSNDPFQGVASYYTPKLDWVYRAQQCPIIADWFDQHNSDGQYTLVR